MSWQDDSLAQSWGHLLQTIDEAISILQQNLSPDQRMSAAGMRKLSDEFEDAKRWYFRELSAAIKRERTKWFWLGAGAGAGVVTVVVLRWLFGAR